MADLGEIQTFLPKERKFTEILDTLPDPPTRLYAYGRFPGEKIERISAGTQTGSEFSLESKVSSLHDRDVRPKTVAIVGARRNTKYGAEIAYQMAYDLAKSGVVVVSGLAYGVDSIAHRGAVAAGGVTVAVLGTPIDRIYPVSHTDLARQIVATGGAILSEYAPRKQTYSDVPMTRAEYFGQNKRLINCKISFLERNRLISGLSDVVVVVEAAERSGTLNTAAHALSQGREVVAVPGNITNATSRGCNRLIAQGATPYTGVDDLLVMLGVNLKASRGQRTISGDTPEETAILKLIKSGVKDGEAIMERLQLSVASFNQTITFLEVKGRVRPLGANFWALN